MADEDAERIYWHSLVAPCPQCGQNSEKIIGFNFNSAGGVKVQFSCQKPDCNTSFLWTSDYAELIRISCGCDLEMEKMAKQEQLNTEVVPSPLIM